MKSFNQKHQLIKYLKEKCYLTIDAHNCQKTQKKQCLTILMKSFKQKHQLIKYLKEKCYLTIDAHNCQKQSDNFDEIFQTKA